MQSHTTFNLADIRLTHSVEKGPSDTLILLQLVNQFPVCYGIQTLIAVFVRAKKKLNKIA
jgi:hypothetical protein